MYLKVPVVINGKESIQEEYTYTVNTFPFDRIHYWELPYIEPKGKKSGYYNTSNTFDVETTTIDTEKDEKGNYITPPYGFMYHWQFCLSTSYLVKYVCFGRTWEEYVEFMRKLSYTLNLNKNRRLVVYVHFLSFEFQFIKDFTRITSMFAKDVRKPLYFTDILGFEFRCSYFLSNKSLRKFCESSRLCTHYKLDGEDYDYKKIRTPYTELSKELELPYCFNDVYGLAECIDSFLADGEDIQNIPLTSTGFVRRGAREAMNRNPKNRKTFLNTKLNPPQYLLLKECARGGDTHASRFYSHKIMNNVHSVDEKSAYIYVMLVSDRFPVGKFKEIRNIKELDFREKICKYACIFRIGIFNISVIDECPDVYIPIAKCYKMKGVVNENGRVLCADYIELAITEIDFEIIEKCYHKFEFVIKEFFYTDRGKLPKELRQYIMGLFKQKTDLENGDKYMYMKKKNELNANFGMMLTAIDHPTIEYDSEKKEWTEQKTTDIQGMLDGFYKSRNSFLSYQHGCYVTAIARYALFELKQHAWEEAIYWDTDSCKYFGGKLRYWVDKINEERIEKCINNDIPAYVEREDGTRAYLGVFEDDGEYRNFKTLGSKKYAYTDKKGFHITVSGMSKSKGAERIGSIENFRITGKPLEDVGRTVSYYNEADIHEITVNGDTFTTASNIGVVDTTYTLGITGEYYSILEKYL